MKKRFEFNINKYLLDLAERPIRTKKDIVLLLTETMEQILTRKIIIQKDSGLEKIIIYVGKMSRIIFSIEKKIFSFAFPFEIYQDEEKNIIFQKNEINMDYIILSKIKSVFYALDDFENLFDIISNFDCDYYKMIIDLITFEDGYVRYDYDEEHANGKLHPLNHLDINYNGKNQYKIGLNKEIDYEKFIDIINLETNCYFIEKQ